MSSRAVFFDRDDTLIEDPGYLNDPEAVRPLPGAPEAVRTLREAGYQIIVATNQSGLARGLIDEPTLERVHERMRQLFAEQGAAIDAIYYCPYLEGPEATVEQYRRPSDLRKPAPGMFLRAARERNIDLSASWAIGDSDRDTLAGLAAGCRTIQLVREGRPAPTARADYRAATLDEAVRIILAAPQRPASPPSLEGLERIAQPLQEIVQQLGTWDRRMAMADFTLSKLAGTVAQLFAAAAGFWALMGTIDPPPGVVISSRWFAAIFLQLLALTFFLLHRQR